MKPAHPHHAQASSVRSVLHTTLLAFRAHSPTRRCLCRCYYITHCLHTRRKRHAQATNQHTVLTRASRRIIEHLYRRLDHHRCQGFEYYHNVPHRSLLEPLYRFSVFRSRSSRITYVDLKSCTDDSPGTIGLLFHTFSSWWTRPPWQPLP